MSESGFIHNIRRMIDEYETSTMNALLPNANRNLLNSMPEILFAYVGTTILIFGTVGNHLNIILFARLESLSRLASSLFLLISFIASEGVLLTALLTRVIHGFTGFDPTHSSIIICKMRWMIRTSVNAISLTCICLAAIDRYHISCGTVRHNRVITMEQARWAIFFTILFWSCVFSSYAVFYTSPTPLSCTITNSIFSYFVSYFNLLHYSILPLTILSTFCYLTWKNLGQQPLTYLNGSRRLRDQVTRMLIAQSFLICMTSIPNMIWQIYVVTTGTLDKSPLRQAEENLISAICILIGHLPHASAFYIYAFASSSFRRGIKKIFWPGDRITPTDNSGQVRPTVTCPTDGRGISRPKIIIIEKTNQR